MDPISYARAMLTCPTRDFHWYVYPTSSRLSPTSIPPWQENIHLSKDQRMSKSKVATLQVSPGRGLGFLGKLYFYALAV